ncbi:MAG: helix-hairpin-helix domain-containing protein [Actinomycetota bacterium]
MDEIVIPSGWRERLQELAGRRREARSLLLFVGALALLALVIGGREAPAQIAPPASGPAPTGAASPAAGGPVLVHVAGAVRRPELYEFPAGARVADAIDTAGGPLPKADLDALNLAQPLVDGAQVLVPLRGDDAPATNAPTGTTTGISAIPLNSADQAQLETIPGIGPVTATAILELRDELGGYESLDQLLDVDGIGPATLDDIRSYLTL